MYQKRRVLACETRSKNGHNPPMAHAGYLGSTFWPSITPIGHHRVLLWFSLLLHESISVFFFFGIVVLTSLLGAVRNCSGKLWSHLFGIYVLCPPAHTHAHPGGLWRVEDGFRWILIDLAADAVALMSYRGWH